MKIILLSGGSGKRLWPLSNDVRSKQFIKFFRKPDSVLSPDAEEADRYESMVQRVYRQIKAADPDASITIATSKSQVSAIHNQLGRDVGISVEPCRRDTFPAIALATAYLHDVQGAAEDEAVVVCPVDPYVNDDYFQAVKKLWELARDGEANLMLMGIDPTYPSEKYGYILPVSKDQVSKVAQFKEKPSVEKAQEYIAAGGLWNGGVFAYKLSYVLNRAHDLIDFTDYRDLFAKYDSLTRISFDYAVVEQEKEISVMRFNGQWKDIGTWNTLAESMEERCIGRAVPGEDCQDVNIVNELDIPILAMGLKDAIIAASPDGILVTSRDASTRIKPYVDLIDQQIMYAEKSWGSYQVIDAEEKSLTIKVMLNPGHFMNYHSHDRRDEVWTIISGRGRTIVDGQERSVKAGDIISMPAGSRHTILADTKLTLIEVQLGTDIHVADKRKYEMP